MPRRLSILGVPLLLLADSALLTAGLLLPALRTERPFSTDSLSILGGVRELFVGGDVALGLLITAFSVVFPYFKLGALAVIWRRGAEADRERMVWLGVLGKWSMLDVFVVVLFVGAVRLGLLAEFEPRVGVYLFAASILLTMTATHVVEHRRGHRVRLADDAGDRLHAWPWRAVSLAALAAFAAGISLPMMTVEKWYFWSDSKSAATALAALFEQGAHGLAALLAVFVFALPALRLLGIAAARLTRRAPARLLRALLVLESWSMLDVFALALLVSVAQLVSMTAVTPHEGLYWLLAAAVLSAIDAWQLRRCLRPRR